MAMASTTMSARTSTVEPDRVSAPTTTILPSSRYIRDTRPRMYMISSSSTARCTNSS